MHSQPSILLALGDGEARERIAAWLAGRYTVLADAAASGVEDVAVVVCDLRQPGLVRLLTELATRAPHARRLLLVAGAALDLEAFVVSARIDLVLECACSATTLRLAVARLVELWRGVPSSNEDAGGGLARPGAVPTYLSLRPRLAAAMRRDRAVACLFIEHVSSRRAEVELGDARQDAVAAQLGEILEGARGSVLRSDDVVCRADDAVLVFLSPARATPQHSAEGLELLARRVKAAAEAALARASAASLHAAPRVAVGHGQAVPGLDADKGRAMGRAIREARDSAATDRQRRRHLDRALLTEAILGGQVGAVYQPIVRLDVSQVCGFEALARGPAGTPLASPHSLFSLAEQVDMLVELDRACLRAAIRGAAGLSPVQRLFVNCLPLAFAEPAFIDHELVPLVAAAGLTPAHVVLEITEHHVVADLQALRGALGRCARLGFSVAMDDVGARHSNLEAVLALRPNVLKLSETLVRGVWRSVVKRETVASLLRIGRAIDAAVVAEGIEDVDDLTVLAQLGVHYGQGFVLGRAGPAFPELPQATVEVLRAFHSGALPRILSTPEPDFDVENGEFRTHVVRRADPN